MILNKDNNFNLLHRIIESFPRMNTIKNYNNKTSFVIPEWTEGPVNKTGINFMIFMLIFMANIL